MLLYKRRVVLRRVDAEGRLVDHADEDRMAGLQDAKLFELLDLLQAGRRHGGELQEEVAAIGVEPDVLVEMRRIGRQQGIVPFAGMRDRAAAEIQCPARRSNTTFTQAGSSSCRRLRIGVASVVITASGCDSSSSMARSIELPAISGSSPCTLTMISTSGIRRATSATRSVPLAAVGIGHFHLAAEGPHLAEDLVMVGRHANAGRPRRALRGFVGMLDQRLAGLGQQQLSRQPGRGEPGGDDDVSNSFDDLYDSLVKARRHPLAGRNDQKTLVVPRAVDQTLAAASCRRRVFRTSSRARRPAAGLCRSKRSSGSMPISMIRQPA